MDWQTGELMAPAPIKYGFGTPSLMAPGQKARVLLALIDRILPEEVQVRVVSPSTSEGVIHGRGRTPSFREGLKDALQPGGMPHGSHLSGEVGHATRPLRGSRDLVIWRKAEQCEEGYLKDVCRGRRDGRGDAQN